MNQDKVYDKTLYDNLDYERDKIRRIENQVKAKPTEKDLKIAISVLKDFGITATISDIPDVKSVYELEKWKARLIKIDWTGRTNEKITTILYHEILFH